jgi:hypothetical protein
MQLEITDEELYVAASHYHVLLVDQGYMPQVTMNGSVAPVREYVSTTFWFENRVGDWM